MFSVRNILTGMVGTMFSASLFCVSQTAYSQNQETTDSETPFPSMWIFTKHTTPQIKEIWENQVHAIQANECGKGVYTVLSSDGKPLENYKVARNRPAAGPVRPGDYMLFSVPVKDFPSRSFVEFDATLSFEPGAPVNWVIEWRDGDKWIEGKHIEAVVPSFTAQNRYVSVFQTFRLTEPVEDGEVQVRIRALEGGYLPEFPGLTEAETLLLEKAKVGSGAMLVTSAYVGAYLQDFGVVPPKDTLDVLCIGNSFTYYLSCPGMLKELAWNEGHYIDVEASLKGGWTMGKHKTLETTVFLAAKGGYDFMILQDQSQIPAKVGMDKKANAQAVDDMASLAAFIRENSPECRTIVECTWAYPGKDGDCGGFGTMKAFDKYAEKGAKIMAKAIDKSEVSPIAEAFAIVREERPEIDLYDADRKHPSLMGSYLKSCVNYLVIYREPFGDNPADCRVEAEVAAYLRSVAERVVL